MKTAGRYVVVIASGWATLGHKAALGYTDSLPEACAEAHVYGSSASPAAVYDTEVFPATCVHVSHGTVYDWTPVPK